MTTISQSPCRFEMVADQMKKMLPKFDNGITVSWKKTSDGAQVFLESQDEVCVDSIYNVVSEIRKNGALDNIDATSIPDYRANRFGISLTPLGTL